MTFYMSTPAQDLIVKDGRVVGVRAKSQNGKTLNLMAKDGVIRILLHVKTVPRIVIGTNLCRPKLEVELCTDSTEKLRKSFLANRLDTIVVVINWRKIVMRVGAVTSSGYAAQLANAAVELKVELLRVPSLARFGTISRYLLLV